MEVTGEGDGLGAGGDGADGVGGEGEGGEVFGEFGNGGGGEDDGHADAEVKGAEHIVVIDGAGVADEVKDGEDADFIEVDGGIHAGREDAVEVALDAATGDVGQAVE